MLRGRTARQAAEVARRAALAEGLSHREADAEAEWVYWAMIERLRRAREKRRSAERG